MPSESPYVVKGARGRRSKLIPGSAKERHKGQWLACPKPLLQPRPQVLDLPYLESANSHCPKPPDFGQLPLSSARKLTGCDSNTGKLRLSVSGEHEQSGSPAPGLLHGVYGENRPGNAAGRPQSDC